MLFLMVAEYLGTPGPEDLESHVTWLVPKFEQGLFLISGGVDAVPDRPAGAVAILRAETREAALELLDDEPFHRAGLVRHDVLPFHPRVRRLNLDEEFDVPDILRTID